MPKKKTTKKTASKKKTTKKTASKKKKTTKKVRMSKKRCCDCGKVKNRQRAFRPRFGRCEKHREQGKPYQDSCKGCQEARESNIRQPRCISCDAARQRRSTGKAKKTAVAAPVTATTKVASKKTTSAVAVTKIEVPPAPEQQTLAPVAAPLDEPTEESSAGSEVPATASF